MVIVSNTSPLCYLILIGHADVLAKLYEEVHVAEKVIEELRHPDAPQLVREWAMTPPVWLKIHSDIDEPDPTLAVLDPGERATLQLAEPLRADVILTLHAIRHDPPLVLGFCSKESIRPQSR